MARVAARVTDKRVLKLIRAFLKSGVMEDGSVSPVDEGTPQGGPLSRLLSNLVLDDLDKELTRRGHRFCRYADDCNIYVRSRRAGERVMASVSRVLTQKLRLKVNAAVPPVRGRGSGKCPDTRRSNRPCATTMSAPSVSPDSMSLPKPNPVEPPWYVTRMPGGVGGVAPRGVPLSRSMGLMRQKL